MKKKRTAKLAWKKLEGLIPAVVQDAHTLQVLMLGYMDKKALARTLRTGDVAFWSRSRGKLWVKGETSGNFLKLVSLSCDCDGDTLLVKALPAGPTCHLNTVSCFGREAAPGVGFLARLSRVIENRAKKPPKGSYTAELFKAGLDRMAQKVGEEAIEVVLAAKGSKRGRLLGESADLIFHLMVLLRAKGSDLGEVVETLRERHAC